MNPIRYGQWLELSSVPMEWASTNFELFWNEHPMFPQIYVHFLSESMGRTYGFPVQIQFPKSSKKDGYCNPRVLFLCNKNLENNTDLRDEVRMELEERFGISGKFGLADTVSYCKKKKHKKFFEGLWPYLEHLYGPEIPYGKFFEETYSIIRYSASWATAGRGGKATEMRELYWIMTLCGKKVDIEYEDYQNIEFFLVPTYEELESGKKLSEFKEFSKLSYTCKKIFTLEYTGDVSLKASGMKYKAMPRGWGKSKDEFKENITRPYIKSGKLTEREGKFMEKLVDAFNRNPTRTSFFVWALFGKMNLGYKDWEKQHFRDFYLNHDRVSSAKSPRPDSPGLFSIRGKKPIGVSPKIVACFLQQGFGNEEVIPIDTWVEAFYEGALGITSKEKFLDSFDNLGKIERIIWLLTAKARKANLITVFDILWCVKHGTRGGDKAPNRGANPISCYECLLRADCPGYANIHQKKVFVDDDKKFIRYEEKLKENPATLKANKAGCDFICLTEGNVPVKIYQRIDNSWRLKDEHSGYLLSKDHDEITSMNGKAVTVDDFIDDLPVFKGGLWQR